MGVTLCYYSITFANLIHEDYTRIFLHYAWEMEDCISHCITMDDLTIQCKLHFPTSGVQKGVLLTLLNLSAPLLSFRLQTCWLKCLNPVISKLGYGLSWIGWLLFIFIGIPKRISRTWIMANHTRLLLLQYQVRLFLAHGCRLHSTWQCSVTGCIKWRRRTSSWCQGVYLAQMKRRLREVLIRKGKSK